MYSAYACMLYAKKYFVPLISQKTLKTLSITMQPPNVILITQPNDTAE